MILGSAQKSSRQRPWLLSIVALILLLAAVPARAGIVISAESVPASAGAFDVTLMNTGASDVLIGGFYFEVNVSSSQVTLTDATINTTANPYIFAGNSLFGPDILVAVLNGGQTLDASDVYSGGGGGVTVAAGASVGLGNVDFTIAGTLASDATVTFTAFPVTNLSDATGANVPIDTLTSGTISAGTGVVPEPSTLTMATTCLAFCGATWFVRRQRQKTPAFG